MTYYFMNDSGKLQITEIFDSNDEQPESEEKCSRIDIKEEPLNSPVLDNDQNDSKWMIQQNG